MRDAKSLLLLLVSLLLVLVSFVLIWTWGYRFYTKNDAYNVNAKILLTDSNAIGNRIRDSLQKVYNETLHTLDTQLDSTLVHSDSLKAQLDTKLAAFFKLSNEITVLLKSRSNEDANFSVAKQKIGELQNKAEDLKDKNTVVENENKKLGDILDQMDKPGKGPEKIIKQAGYENNVQTDKNNPVYGVFTVFDLRLSAFAVNDDKEQETSDADKTKKLVGTFTVLNNIVQLSSAEMVVVVMQPDGRVLMNSEWESGSFNTTEGKKIYSYKVNFSYQKGDPKRLLFSLKADKYLKGDYTMQVYYNGTMIGKMIKTLS